jgi:hypothetical protein
LEVLRPARRQQLLNNLKTGRQNALGIRYGARLSKTHKHMLTNYLKGTSTCGNANRTDILLCRSPHGAHAEAYDEKVDNMSVSLFVHGSSI